MNYKPTIINPRTLRQELGLTQAELADVLGISERTIQSWEQGCRKPGTALEKTMLALIAIKRQKKDPSLQRCWERLNCSQDYRATCPVYNTSQGHLCWFMTGNSCNGVKLKGWSDKKMMCAECKHFCALFNGVVSLEED